MLTALLLVVPTTGLGYFAATLATGKLHEALVIASTTLLFGALLGGLVKLLLEGVQRTRDQRADHAQFVRAVLADLKAVHDRTERVRTLIAAHQSARTYGDEMCDLIDSGVQLRNVKRALNSTSGITTQQPALKSAVRSMEHYLKSLIDEFTREYKPIADEQRIYEAAFKTRLESQDPRPPHNAPWDDLSKLPKLTEFLGRSEPVKTSPIYTSSFLEPLEVATLILRSELTRLATGRRPKLSSKKTKVYGRLPD